MEEDPSGECECVINDVTDILLVEQKPAYWDGAHEVLVRDEKLNPFHNVVGGKISTEGLKVSILTLSLEDALFDSMAGKGKDFPIELDISYVDPKAKKRWTEIIDGWKEEAKNTIIGRKS